MDLVETTRDHKRPSETIRKGWRQCSSGHGVQLLAVLPALASSAMPKRREGTPTVEASPLAGMLYFPSALIVDGVRQRRASHRL